VDGRRRQQGQEANIQSSLVQKKCAEFQVTFNLSKSLSRPDRILPMMMNSANCCCTIATIYLKAKTFDWLESGLPDGRKSTILLLLRANGPTFTGTISFLKPWQLWHK
jgi:hypothetical protein